MKKKMAVGILFGALLLYLSFRGIAFQTMTDGLKAVRYGYVAPAVFIFFFMQVLRSLRWRAILKPLEKIDQLIVFAVTSIGFLAIMALPARLGELARPYLITKKSNITMSSALGTVLIERLADILAILLMLACALIVLPMPLWLIKPGITLLIITLIIAAVIAFLITQKERSLTIVGRLLGLLPDRYAVRLNRLVDQLIDGLAVAKDPLCLFWITFYSLFIWAINVVSIYLMFLAFGFDLSPVAALVLMVVLIVGIAIPTAPGFVGNWHFFCILSLGLFGIARADALTFAVIYHFLSIGVIAVLGLIFLPFYSFSLSDLKQGSNKSS
jgi:hypothetical protein